ncbi:hypothetical protein Ahy_A07g036507 isoform B [Arachis hypogaea]|uniref:Uncharacterized protein n=1 Tax=Arachis hypogaea TaxID=3818 RepID=A0A445CGE9_ARAHY|nr:hypothetical protein Ahy_A07g036507 isoform B [Arachis hypogaea]
MSEEPRRQLRRPRRRRLLRVHGRRRGRLAGGRHLRCL